MIIATGFTYNSPIKSEGVYSVTQRTENLKKFEEQVNSAKSVLIKGAGIVGVELAGELAFHPHAPDKKITLALRGSRLLP